MRKLNLLFLLAAWVAVALVACDDSVSTPVPTESPTQVPTETPTRVPTETPAATATAIPTPLPTPTATAIPTPNLTGRIVFSGFRCPRDDRCLPGSDFCWESNLYIVNSDGTGLRVLAAENTPRLLDVSPDGTHLLFSDYRDDTNGNGEVTRLDQPQIFVLELATLEVQLLATGFSWAEWLPDGRTVVYGGRGNVYTAQYDGTDRKTVVAMGLSVRSGSHFALSPDGSRGAYIACAAGEELCTLYSVGIDGTGQRAVAAFPNQADSAYVSWSPRGDRLAVAAPSIGMRKQVDVYSVEVDGGEVRQAYHSDEGLVWLQWLPDGQRLGLATGAGDDFCFEVNADGTGLRGLSFPESLGVCVGGERSPAGRLFATSLSGDWDSGRPAIEPVGLSVLSVDTGWRQQVLSGYSIDDLAWLSDEVVIP